MKFAIDVKKGTDKESIESLGETILSSLSDDIKDYYDIQLIVNCKEDSKFVPLIASKHKTRKVFVWWCYEQKEVNNNNIYNCTICCKFVCILFLF